MNIFFGAIRERIQAVIGLAIGTVLMFVCGGVLAFVIAPQQALEWRRIEKLPVLSANGVANAAVGEEIVVTGILAGNDALTDDGFVAYTLKEWKVDPPSDQDDDYEGSWGLVERVVPALILNVAGEQIHTLSNNSARLDGINLHESYQDGTGVEKATDSSSGQYLAEGALQWQGFKDGDLVTVVGQKASTGDVTPDRLFAGDKVQLVEHIRTGARAAFIGGIACMIGSPFVFILGLLGIAFGRRRKVL